MILYLILVSFTLFSPIFSPLLSEKFNRTKMENTNNFQCDENVNFRWYLDMFKDDEMTWKIFFQMMKDMISFLDLVKSKKLIFDLLEELKGFKDKFSELEKSNDVLRKENENLKNELKTKSASNVVINENHKDLSNNSEDYQFVLTMIVKLQWKL